MREISENGADERRKRGRGVIVAVVVAVSVAAVVGTGILYIGVDFSVATLTDTIRSWGVWGAAASVGLMILHSFIPFPAELLAFANGILFGVVWGTVITWVGAMLGASVAFGLARRFGRPFVKRMVAARQWETVDRWADRNGWQAVLVGRFVPVIAFNLINYAAGLTRITWWQFLWTTGVGILPMTLMMVIMGDRMEQLGWQTWAALLAGGLILWVGLRAVARRRGRG